MSLLSTLLLLYHLLENIAMEKREKNNKFSEKEQPPEELSLMDLDLAYSSSPPSSTEGVSRARMDREIFFRSSSTAVILASTT